MSDDRPQIATPGPSEARLRGLTRLLQASGERLESVVVGDSMGDVLPAGTRIRITCDGHGRLPDGTVVAFAAGEQVVAHRIVGRGRWSRAAREFVITRGDGRVLCDPPVHRGLVLGRVTGFRRDGQWHDPPSAPPPGVTCRLTTLAVVLALEVHVGFARLVHAALYRPATAVGRLFSARA